ncbi:hypothetical protein N7510_007076 [Penicillium lagena]|uniref:uncharacterized protein n=1 Tax=Penicillium lagena TaxID=94218 RepID=UPI0025414C3C|nr:uncharacterized protein N7510_007076 [Penicillium lagena]KAJ5610357.1 hypothetical protein N7510_007076 [Penicillium lagena]
MAAPRSSSLRALRVLSQQHSTTTAAAAPARRNLHITGVHSAQPANPADKASLYSARSVPDLKLECQRRSLRSAGSQSELIERLSNHDVLQSRAFSIAMRRINGSAFSDTPTTRPFNTSRSSKSIHDTSPVDLVYMPSLADLDAPSAPSYPRVPILPDLSSSSPVSSSQSPHPYSGAPPMKPQIYTVAGAGADVAASPMSEVTDNHAVDIDPFSLTEAVGRSRVGEELSRGEKGRREPGIVRELWTGFLDDVLGPKEVPRRT